MEKQTKVRQVKLQGKYRAPVNPWSNGGKTVPWLNVSGVWLEAAGFKVGSMIEITTENNLLIIKALPDGDSRD